MDVFQVLVEKHNAAIGGFIAVVTYILGDHWVLFALFLAFNVADWITGWIKSRLAGKENSVAGLNGVIKKFCYWLMILVAFWMSAFFVEAGETLGVDLGVTKLLGWFVLASLTVNEIRSILENFVEAGFDVPKILVDGLSVADTLINKQGGEDNDGSNG